MIRAQERAATSQAEELLRQLEQEIGELKKRDAELSQLAQTENQITFLQVELFSLIAWSCMDLTIAFRSVAKISNQYHSAWIKI